ncbi:MAG TPA: phospho-sugar mutase [Candidatus Fimenecus excrementavium]|nr:phospho-sugar mutase [Candidatus Fimenecus excrementavium]
MDYKERYNEWLLFDDDTKQELLKITDEKEIEDRFYKDLAFGTGGMRGIMGAGPNRMNRYTISRATLGLANYLSDFPTPQKSVVIAYDSRNNSEDFAKCAAEVLAVKGITVYLFDKITPTPVLSFAVRHLGCIAGIVITASHNPKEYNGYKVYDENGCQLVPSLADKVIAHVQEITDYRAVPRLDFEVALQSGMIQMVGDEVLDAFLDALKTQALYTEPSKLKIVYTPLHGTGNIPVRRILKDYSVSVVKEQAVPDGDFSTVRSPNPEEKDALNLAIEQAKTEAADLVLGTDPDCDRVGIAVRHNGDYVLLTGNQVGALLADFVLRFKADTRNEKSTLVKTIVTNDLGANIGRKYGLQIVETLTGFKYIGDQINRYEKTGEKEFVMGYEESYGYLVGTHARDKDAVVASMLICEMTAYHKNNGKTLVDALEEIYKEYGYYLDALDSFVLQGIDGVQKMNAVLDALRARGASAFPDVETVQDFSEGIGDLPKENVLKYLFRNGSWLAVRPSGTEPKLKVYYSVRGESHEAAAEQLSALREQMKAVVEA